MARMEQQRLPREPLLLLGTPLAAGILPLLPLREPWLFLGRSHAAWLFVPFSPLREPWLFLGKPRRWLFAPFSHLFTKEWEKGWG